MTSWLLLLLVSGHPTDAVEMPTAACLTAQQAINESTSTYANMADGRREMVLGAVCRPWPPIDPCDCDDEGLTQ